MAKRKLSYLVMCIAEALRDLAVFYAFLPIAGGKNVGGGLLLCIVFAPSLLIPLAWYYLWADTKAHQPFFKLITPAKALGLCASFFWLVSILFGYKKTILGADSQAIAQFASWALVIISDWILAGFTFRLARKALITPPNRAPAVNEGQSGADNVETERNEGA
jgi:hypothetical protein